MHVNLHQDPVIPVCDKAEPLATALCDADVGQAFGVVVLKHFHTGTDCCKLQMISLLVGSCCFL